MLLRADLIHLDLQLLDRERECVCVCVRRAMYFVQHPRNVCVCVLT